MSQLRLGLFLLFYNLNYMANFTAKIACANGYNSQDVYVEGVITQSAAKRALEARYPGAIVRAVRITQN